MAAPQRQLAERAPVSARLARFTVDTARADIPDAAIEKARGCLADYLACTLEAGDLPWSRQAVAFVEPMPDGACSVVGTKLKPLFVSSIELFLGDPETEGIIMIGEIGGNAEAEGAELVRESGNRKPVVGFIAGVTAPKGRTMGHAGAIVSGEEESAEAKKAVMRECGIHVVDSPAQLGAKMVEALGVQA